MIDLSHQAAKRFGIDWKVLEERSGDFWKIDVMMIGRVPMVLIVHEFTLFTLVRRKRDYGDLQTLANEVLRACPWYRGPESFSLGKNGDRKLTGSISEMKRLTTGLYSPDQINAMEMAINPCIFSYLSAERDGTASPFEAVESYVNGRTPWLL